MGELWRQWIGEQMPEEKFKRGQQLCADFMGNNKKIHLTNNFVLTLFWLLFPFSFFLSWICVEIWSPLAFVCKMKMSKPECIVSLQTDHLLLTKSRVMPETLFVTSLLFRKWGCSTQTIILQPSITSSSFPLPFPLPCYWKQQNLGLLGEFLRRESICLYIIYLFTHWDMFSLPRHTRYVPNFSLQHVLQISSPPPPFPCFTLSESCLREILLIVNWKP